MPKGDNSTSILHLFIFEVGCSLCVLAHSILNIVCFDQFLCYYNEVNTFCHDHSLMPYTFSLRDIIVQFDPFKESNIYVHFMCECYLFYANIQGYIENNTCP